MTYYEPALVYENVRKMLSYRGMEPVEAEITEAMVNRTMNTHGIIKINARKIGGEQTVFTAIIFAPQSDFLTKTPEMNKALSHFVRYHDAAVKTNAAAKDYNLMVVGSSFDPSSDNFSIHIMKALYAFGRANAHIYLEICDYATFLIELPKHCMSVRHWIPPQSEVDEYCKKYSKKITDFPRIKAKDAQATWIGLRPGMVCAVDRVSETAGKAFVYKICTN